MCLFCFCFFARYFEKCLNVFVQDILRNVSMFFVLLWVFFLLQEVIWYRRWRKFFVHHSIIIVLHYSIGFTATIKLQSFDHKAQECTVNIILLRHYLAVGYRVVYYTVIRFHWFTRDQNLIRIFVHINISICIKLYTCWASK